jgi:hypothetical protein
VVEGRRHHDRRPAFDAGDAGEVDHDDVTR